MRCELLSPELEVIAHIYSSKTKSNVEIAKEIVRALNKQLKENEDERVQDNSKDNRS